MVDFISDNWWPLLIVANYVLVISTVITILLNNINPTKTVSYIIVLALFPFFGLLVYYMFGQQYRKTKIFNRKHIVNSKVIQSVRKNARLEFYDANALHGKLDDKIKLVKLLKSSERSPLTMRNEAKILYNGEEKFEYLLHDLRCAKNHIHLEYYIIKDDTIGTALLDIVCEKARQGIDVKIVYDDVGSSLSSAMKHQLKESGVNYRAFMPVVFSSFTGKSNYRNHRKIAIIDGAIGYVGGINISDNYINSHNTKLYWRDTHFRVFGEAVRVLQFHFLTTWDFVNAHPIIVRESYFPDITCEKELAIQIAASGPDTDWANIMEAILTAINNAERYIYITTPYFIPNDQLITALQIASKIGIDVRLIIPKYGDNWISESATNSFLQPLLEVGVSVYRYSKGFIHAKTMVVDDIFSTIGTCNLDNRSFNINFEINALIYDSEESKMLKSQFIKDFTDSEIVDFETWKKRPKIQKMKESLSRLVAPLL